MNTVKVDFNDTQGKIKPLHSVCLAPYSVNDGDNQRDISRLFTEARIPYCRLHDCQGAYGGAYFVDIANIFRNFDADENDPNNYEFHYTDEYVSAIQKAGAEAYYRLGETIEWGSKKYRALPPADFEKWARICEHVVAHYNEGWANGFNYGIKYWEIWNEPENPGNRFGSSMFNGSKEDYFRLYETAAKHLKKRFPNILIGGYGSCGFYPVTRERLYEGWDRFVPYFHDFLKMVKSTDTPLDFFSWHIYTADVDEILSHAKYVREALDAEGLTETESHLNEWNIHSEGSGFAAKHTLEGASFNGAVLTELCNTGLVDLAAYYCFSARSMYNGFMNQNDLAIDPPFYSFVAFGMLYNLGTSVKSDAEGIYSLAAANGAECAVMLTNYKAAEDKTELCYKNAKGKTAHILMLDEKHSLEEVFSSTVPENGTLTLSVPERSIALIKFM